MSDTEPSKPETKGRPAKAGRFSGKAVVITGASSGVGAAAAEAFSAEGARTVLFARAREALDCVAKRCRQVGAEPLVVQGDVTKPEDCARLIDATVERFGAVDAFIACAGVGMWARFDELQSPAVLREVMEVNYLGVATPALLALPWLKKSRGVLTAVSSIQGRIGVPYHSGYSASKHALQGFCNSLRIELRETGVDVVTVLAHWIHGTRFREQALGGDGAPRGSASHRHGRSAVSVAEVTAAILDATAKRKRSVFVPGWLRYLSLLAEIAPGRVDRLVAARVDAEASRKRCFPSFPADNGL